MLCALGKALAHRVAPGAVWIPYCSTFAYATVCGHVAKPADPDVVDTYPKCPDCAEPYSAERANTEPCCFRTDVPA